MPEPDDREPVLLMGGPCDGHVLGIPEGETSVRVVVVVRSDRSWAQVDQDGSHGHIQGEVVGVGCYSRTEWREDGKAVFRFRPMPGQ